jgi:hypothetical protein
VAIRRPDTRRYMARQGCDDAGRGLRRWGMDKKRKTRQELKQVIMEQIRQRPGWNDIVGVAILERDRTASHLPNWDAAFTVNGSRVAPEGAFLLVNELRNKYELSEG